VLVEINGAPVRKVAAMMEMTENPAGKTKPGADASRILRGTTVLTGAEGWPERD